MTGIGSEAASRTLPSPTEPARRVIGRPMPVELSAAPQHSARRQPAPSGGSMVVRTAKYIRYVYPARGTTLLKIARWSGDILRARRSIGLFSSLSGGPNAALPNRGDLPPALGVLGGVYLRRRSCCFPRFLEGRNEKRGRPASQPSALSCNRQAIPRRSRSAESPDFPSRSRLDVVAG